MDPVFTTIAWIVGAVLALVAFFAQIRLFMIAKELKEIKNELLIFRQERQYASQK